LTAVRGEDGADGPAGPAGADGTEGPQGPEGPAGPAGLDGREVEIHTSEYYIEWRYAGGTESYPIISIADITGPQGPQGPQGESGEPGEPGEQGAAGESARIQPCEYNELSGFQAWITEGGTPGWGPCVVGSVGEDGREVEIRAGDESIEWRYADSDSEWQSIVLLEDLMGPEGPQGPSIQPNWTQADTTELDFIRNRPPLNAGAGSNLGNFTTAYHFGGVLHVSTPPLP